MPNSKNYSIREQVLDRYLGSGRWYSRQQLEDFCNRALTERGESPVTSRTTLLNDMVAIANKYAITIETKRVGKIVFYRYKQRDFSIYKSELSEQEYHYLMEALNVLRRFKGMPQFDWVEELDVRFRNTFLGRVDQRTIVGFQDGSGNSGMEHFTPLFNAITDKVTLLLTYQGSRRKEPWQYTVSPYYLKEYNKRWFLLGKSPGYERISTYALDRIVSIENAGIPYEDTDIDFDQRYQDVVGITISEGERQQVDIRFSQEQAKYVLTKPLHHSQQVVSEDGEGIVLRLEVIPNYELEQAILSFGEHAEVLAPAWLREKMNKRIADALKRYGHVHFL